MVALLVRVWGGAQTGVGEQLKLSLSLSLSLSLVRGVELGLAMASREEGGMS